MTFLHRILPLPLFLTAAVAISACDGAGQPPGPYDEVPDPPFVEQPEVFDSSLSGVVMIVVDTLRADHVGAFGSDRGLTPEIDALAERSHVFEHAIAASSWTRPSIASMLTSRFPTSMGLLDKTDSLQESAVTLPEVLRDQAGFQTFAVITNGNIDAQLGFDQGFDHFVWPHLRRHYPDDFAIHVAEGVTQKVLELLDRRDPRRPFFLFALYVDPHDPYLPHPELMPEPEPKGRFNGSRAQLSVLDLLGLRAEPADYDRIRHLYAGEVRYVDHWIGKLLDGLEERGLTNDVMITLTSDHGEGLWSHNRRGHGNDLYEESVHVPLVVKYPRSTQASRISSPVSLVDLAPTVLAAAGAPKPPSFHGFDLSPLTRGESRGAAFNYVYTEMDHRNQNFDAIRYDGWKLIRKKGSAGTSNGPTTQLFDLASDAGEKHNLANDRRAPNRRRLASALDKWHLAVLDEAASRRQVASSELDHGTLENLRGLGYLGDAETDAVSPETEQRELGRIPVYDLPQVSASRLDLSSAGAAHAQLLAGFAPGLEDSTWITRESSVVLSRQAVHEAWELDIEVDSANEQTPLELRIVPEGGDAADIDILSPGYFRIEGSLPPESAEGVVILFIECSPPGEVVSSDGDAQRSRPAPTSTPCVRVTRIALR